MPPIDIEDCAVEWLYMAQEDDVGAISQLIDWKTINPINRSRHGCC
jgi:hypothetical protein